MTKLAENLPGEMGSFVQLLIKPRVAKKRRCEDCRQIFISDEVGLLVCQTCSDSNKSQGLKGD